MTSVERKEWVRDTYLDKKVVTRTDFTGIGLPKGLQGKVYNLSENTLQTVLNVEWEEGFGRQNVYAFDVDVIQEAPIIHKEKEGIKILKRTLENVDEYGNAYIIQLLPPDEKYIYLSSALRTLLDVQDGDAISFAIDNENKLYYVCKENDKANGYEVVNGKIESNVEWRNLYNCFNSEKTKIEEGKLKFHISHYEREQEDVPDYHLFLINHPWFQESKKKVKEVKFEEMVKPITKPYTQDVEYMNKLVEDSRSARMVTTSYTIPVEEKVTPYREERTIKKSPVKEIKRKISSFDDVVESIESKKQF